MKRVECSRKLFRGARCLPWCLSLYSLHLHSSPSFNSILHIHTHQHRLCTRTPECDKVLTVERVIDSLGLETIRNSLVGTVEKRGISGGQRKRVNVGIEMVMKPSLLILDEPTSGLDSTSSQLLLKALCREALEGTNICAVIHQPSYTLYNMFDDLILLAKGGLLVYSGPVNTVEEYFTTLGIHVPDRVNPPDHYIDILEGIVETDSGIEAKNLPLHWMLYNGYEVPNDMKDDLQAMHAGNRTSLLGSTPYHLPNITGERDRLQCDLSGPKDLLRRRTPGILIQYKYFLGSFTACIPLQGHKTALARSWPACG